MIIKQQANYAKAAVLPVHVVSEFTHSFCGSVVEHCVSSAKGCGFDSQGTHILMKMYNLNAIKA